MLIVLAPAVNLIEKNVRALVKSEVDSEVCPKYKRAYFHPSFLLT